MTHDTSIDLFVAILSAHKGLTRSISVADMAGRLGFGRDKAGQRKAQTIKALVVEQRQVPIGSSCGPNHGWYWIETEEEMRATVTQYRSRVRSLCLAIANTTVAAGGITGVMRQMAIDFDEEHDEHTDIIRS